MDLGTSRNLIEYLKDALGIGWKKRHLSYVMEVDIARGVSNGNFFKV